MPKLLESKSFFILLLCFVGVLLYLNNLGVPFVYDDIEQITNNNKLKAPANLVDALLTDSRQNRTLQNLTFSLNWAITPNSAISFHVINNALHILNSVLLFLFLLVFLKPRFLPHLTSLFFLIHPLQVQAVTYVMGRISLLQTCIILLILLLFSSSGSRKPLLIFVLLMFSVTVKETCVLIPLFLLAYDVFVNGTNLRYLNWKEHALYSSHIFVAVVYHGYLGSLSAHGTSVGFGLYPIFDYLVVQAQYLTHYFYLFVNPAGQRIYHGYPDLSAFTYFKAGMGACVYIFMVAFIAKSLFRKDCKSVHAFFLSFFLLSLLPTNSFLQMYNPFAEYRLYQSNIVLCAYLSMGLLILAEQRKFIAYLVTGICSAYFMLYTYMHNANWLDPLELWQQAYDSDPNEYTVLASLGFEHARRGMRSEALEHYKRARANAQTSSEKNQSAINVATLYHLTGRIEDAYKIYSDILGIGKYRNNFGLMHNYTVAAHQLGHFSEAAELLEEIEANFGSRRAALLRSKFVSDQKAVGTNPHDAGED